MTTHTTLAARSSSLFAEHLEKSPPDFIYHYTNADALLNICKTSTLRATQVDYLNDSTEFQGALDMLKARLTQEFDPADTTVDINTLPLRKKIALKLWNIFTEPLRTTSIFVICFCCKGDILSQWRGYSGSFGYSIGFRTEKLQNVANGAGFVLGKCIYEMNTQKTIIDEICSHFLDSGRNYIDIMSEIGRVLLECGAFFKDKAFAEENEWRLVSRPPAPSEIEYRRGKSMIIPYISMPIGKAVNSSIDHMYVGPCPHMELSESSLAMMLIQKRISEGSGGSVDVRRSAIPFRDW
jgi:hypothetical protein